jgi:hypothetical protein
MTAADVTNNASLGDQAKPLKPRRRYSPRNAAPCQWPTQEELFNRWWALGPGSLRKTEFWKPRKVAAHLEYSESRVRGLCEEGLLPMLKVGGRIFVHIPSLLRAGFFVRPAA